LRAAADRIPYRRPPNVVTREMKSSRSSSRPPCASRLDLQTVDAERLGALLAALGLSGLGVLEEPLRQLARAHLTVYESAGPVFGRTRKGVSSFERRRDLQHNVAAIDEKATARQVDLYLRRVSDAMAELLG
jgi:hypothetical protein